MAAKASSGEEPRDALTELENMVAAIERIDAVAWAAAEALGELTHRGLPEERLTAIRFHNLVVLMATMAEEASLDGRRRIAQLMRRTGPRTSGKSGGAR